MNELVRASAVVAGLWTVAAAPAASPNPPAGFESVSINVLRAMAIRPVYRVVVTSDGKVDFEGIAYTKVSGHRASQLVPTDVEALAAVVRASDFFALAKTYRRAASSCHFWVTDGLRYEISVTAHGHRDTVSFNSGFGCNNDLADAIRILAVKVAAISGAIDLAGGREL